MTWPKSSLWNGGSRRCPDFFSQPGKIAAHATVRLRPYKKHPIKMAVVWLVALAAFVAADVSPRPAP
jgi:hypothetical protein